MANISLRDYYKEIDSLIDAGKFDVAVDHCVHILSVHPKDLHTYRLLGKTFLEARDYPQAADILGRALAVRSDDFVANVGMSVVREEEGNLDAAIWHMERAFELDTTTPVVQTELKRLYTIRDGSTPEKIRLTKGALIRMYASGGMLQQAVSEILLKFPSLDDRPDMQTLLANLYYQTGQINAAEDVCQKILQKLPYCFDANLILYHSLASQPESDDMKRVRERIVATNPYYAFLQDFDLDVASVPDDAVMITMFTPPAPETAVVEDLAPAWLSEEPPEAELPAAMNLDALSSPVEEALPIEIDQSQDQPQDGSTAEPVMDIPPSEVDNFDLPEWMKDLGTEGEEETAGPVAASGESLDAEDALPADIPEWIREMAPTKPGEEPAPGAGEAAEMDAMFSTEENAAASGLPIADALLGSQPGQSDTSRITPEEGEESPAIPEWLQGFDPSIQALPRKDLDSTLPDWLDEEEPRVLVPENKPFTLEDLPSIQPEPAGPGSPDELVVTGPLSPDRAAGIEKPEWLQEARAESDVDSLFSEPSEQPPAPDDDTEDWLKKFREEPVPVSQDDNTEDQNLADIPDWLREPQLESDVDHTEPVVVNPPPVVPTADTWIPEHSEAPSGPLPSGLDDSTIPDLSALFDEMPDFQKTMAGSTPDASPFSDMEHPRAEQAFILEPDEAADGTPPMDNLPSLIDHYSRQLRAGSDPGAIVEEVKKLAGDHPDDPGIWLVLGDAYHQNKQIQAALDAYAHAEEFLSKSS